MNNTAMNTHIQIFMWIYVFISAGYLLRSIIAESHGHPMFNLLRNCRSVFQSGCTILHPHQQSMRAPIFPNLCQHLLSVFLMIVYVGVTLHFIMALICFSLMANKIEHFFMCLLAICILATQIFVWSSLKVGCLCMVEL